MTLFMFWMVGSNLSLWTIMITISFVMNPIKQLFTIEEAFKQFEGKINLFVPKLRYIGSLLVVLAVAFYRFKSKLAVINLNRHGNVASYAY